MNPLTDILPAKVRKVAYAAVFVIGIAVGIWQTTDGNVAAFVSAFVAALAAALAHSNTDTSAPEAADAE